MGTSWKKFGPFFQFSPEPDKIFLEENKLFQ